MDGENNGKPYEQMDDLGGKATIFGVPPISIHFHPFPWLQGESLPRLPAFDLNPAFFLGPALHSCLKVGPGEDSWKIRRNMGVAFKACIWLFTKINNKLRYNKVAIKCINKDYQGMGGFILYIHIYNNKFLKCSNKKGGFPLQWKSRFCQKM